MASTQKLYKEISEAIKCQLDQPMSVFNNKRDMQMYKAGIGEVVENLCTILKKDNSKFDRDKFLNDCGF